MGGDLAGRRILVPESRDLDLFAGMMEQHGADTLRCPMVKILDLDDPAPARDWLNRLLAGEFHDIILLTGEGLRRLRGVARGMEREEAVVAALGRTRILVRGPKPVKALREVGLGPYKSAPAPTTEGVIQALADADLTGRTVGVQLYPGNPNAPLLDAVRARGGVAVAVTPYRYASDSETGAVEAAIRAMAAGRIDFVAFTASPRSAAFRRWPRRWACPTPSAKGSAGPASPPSVRWWPTRWSPPAARSPWPRNRPST